MNTNIVALGPCVRCGKTLRAVGTSRKGGKAHADWPQRSLHEKCWKEQRLEEITRDSVIGVPDDQHWSLGWGTPLSPGWSIQN